MEKFRNIFYKVMMVLLLIMSVVATVSALGNLYPTTSDYLSPIVIILGVIVLLLFFIRLHSLIKKIGDKKKDIISIIICILFFIGLSLFGIKFSIIPAYDLSHVERELMLMMQNGKILTNIGYFAKYTNQVPLTIILYYIYKLGSLLHFSNVKTFAIIINSLFIAISAFFTYLSIKKISNKDNALLALIFFVINPIFYMYASYYYTDTLCMPFAAIAIYLFLISKDKKGRSSIILLLLCGLILALGFKVRVVVAILLIGIIMTKWLEGDKLKNIAKVSACLLGGFAIGLFTYNLVASSFIIPKDEKLEFPIYHWVMMGLNEERTGRYNEEDHTYTKSQVNKEEKKQADIKVIKERLKNFGIFRYISFLAQKININWSNGAYRYLDKMTNVDEFSVGYEYVAGNNIIFILYALQICKGLILVLLTYVIVLELFKKNNKSVKFIMVSLFGAFLFYLIWEVQARYSLSFLPWLILLFPIGIEALESINIDKNINMIKVKKGVYSLILLLTLGLMIFNFNKYTVNKSIYYDTRVNQMKTRSTVITDLSEKEVKQTFITKGKFNLVSIKFIKEDISELTHYTFYLYDDCDNIIYQSEFTSDDVKNNKYKNFVFDEVYSKEEKEYSIVITSEDATEDNSIGIESFSYAPYKVYPSGYLYINEEDTGASMTFKVQEKVKRTYTSKPIYISICLVILVIEGITLYPCFKKKK